MDALIASLNEKVPNGLDTNHTRVERNRLCDTCQRILKASKLLSFWPDRQLFSNPETLQHSTIGEVVRSARAGCHLCNLIYAEINHDGHPERTSLTANFLVELKLTENVEAVRMGIELLRVPAQAIEDRGYSYGSLHITLQPHAGQYAELRMDSASPTGAQERNCPLNATRMLSSLHKTTSSSKDLARSWLKQCLSHHEKCSSATPSDQFLPSRLLHIKQGTDSVKVHLVLRSEIPGNAQYITLSHCWGGVQPLRLTTESIDGLRHGIDLDDLPKTFYDAVRVTMALRCEYLWIDSLCIIQDSREDWVRESATMGNVYQHSLCTIAALWARNCKEGLFCFRKQTPLALHSCTYTLNGHKILNICRGNLKVPDYIVQGKDAAPLNQRAWVIQERVLARRTLFFGSSMISWECFEVSTCEFPDSFSFYNINDFRANPKRARSFLTATAVAQEASWGQLHTWFSLVEEYSGCGLTKTEDKLVAISGLIKSIEVASGKTNVAGLWKEALGACLLWTPRPNFGNRLIPEFPSWSWASIEGAVTYDGLYGGSLGLQSFDDAMRAEWMVDVIEASSTTLMLCGYLVRAEEVLGWSKGNMATVEDLDNWCGGLMYDLDGHDEDGSWCIPLLSRWSGEEPGAINGSNSHPGSWIAGLTVHVSGTSNTEWKRCGLFDVRATSTLTTPWFGHWMAKRHHEKQLICLL